MTVYGFTGTREGMSHRQVRALGDLLHFGGVDTLHHGCDNGADAQAHRLGLSHNCYIIQHPPTDMKRAKVLPGGLTVKPKPYLERNHDIVDACEVLVAAPRSLTETTRSGTWATVRYARKSGKPVVILDPEAPDGRA